MTQKMLLSATFEKEVGDALPSELDLQFNGDFSDSAKMRQMNASLATISNGRVTFPGSNGQYLWTGLDASLQPGTNDFQVRIDKFNILSMLGGYQNSWNFLSYGELGANGFSFQGTCFHLFYNENRRVGVVVRDPSQVLASILSPTSLELNVEYDLIFQKTTQLMEVFLNGQLWFSGAVPNNFNPGRYLTIGTLYDGNYPNQIPAHFSMDRFTIGIAS